MANQNLRLSSEEISEQAALNNAAFLASMDIRVDGRRKDSYNGSGSPSYDGSQGVRRVSTRRTGGSSPTMGSHMS